MRSWRSGFIYSPDVFLVAFILRKVGVYEGSTDLPGSQTPVTQRLG
jgi:hypothetical protein